MVAGSSQLTKLKHEKGEKDRFKGWWLEDYSVWKIRSRSSLCHCLPLNITSPWALWDLVEGEHAYIIFRCFDTFMGRQERISRSGLKEINEKWSFLLSQEIGTGYQVTLLIWNSIIPSSKYHWQKHFWSILLQWIPSVGLSESLAMGN